MQHRPTINDLRAPTVPGSSHGKRKSTAAGLFAIAERGQASPSRCSTQPHPKVAVEWLVQSLAERIRWKLRSRRVGNRKLLGQTRRPRLTPRMQHPRAHTTARARALSQNQSSLECGMASLRDVCSTFLASSCSCASPGSWLTLAYTKLSSSCSSLSASQLSRLSASAICTNGEIKRRWRVLSNISRSRT